MNIFALLAQFIADWTFLYQASREIWYAGGINDYMYLCSYLIMTLAIIRFNSIFKKIHEA